MTRLTCLLGIHRPIWQPAYRTGRPALGWLQLRTCRHCGQHLKSRR